MPLYFSDVKDGDSLVSDDEGLELPTIEDAEGGRPIARGHGARHGCSDNVSFSGRRIAIEVRDDKGPVFQAKFTFEIARHNH